MARVFGASGGGVEIVLTEAGLGLGRIVALHHRSSTAYQIHYNIRYLFF
jgi:hypothetical protein